MWWQMPFLEFLKHYKPDIIEMNCAAISYPYFGWLDELNRANEKDEWVIAKTMEVILTTQGATRTSATPKYTLDNGFLCYKHRIVFGPTSPWRQKIIEEYHSTSAAGHQGILKTYHKIKKRYYCQGMKKDIQVFMSHCGNCQQNKFEIVSPPRLLQPLPIPSKVWTVISMDFIIGLPLCKTKSMIMVVVDRLSKYSHFMTLAQPYSGATVA